VNREGIDMDLKASLKELGLQLPPAPKPAAVYIPAQRAGDLLYISGQLPMRDGELLAHGAVNGAVSLEQAQQAAQQCALNALAIVDDYLAGDWSRLERFVRLGVFVSSSANFIQQHLVANGASLLLEKLFGERGRHARAAVGVGPLPLGAPVEVEMIVQVR